MAKRAQLPLHVLAVGVGEQVLGAALAQVAPPRCHVALADTPSDALAALEAGHPDLVVVSTPESPGQSWQQLLARATAEAPFGVVVLPPSSASASELAAAVTQALERPQGGDSRARRTSAADSRGLEERDRLVRHAGEFMLSLEPAENLAQYIEELAAGFREAIGLDCVEVEIDSPPLSVRVPRQGALPPTVGALKDLSQLLGASVERHGRGFGSVLVLPLRGQRHSHGYILMSGPADSRLAGALVPVLRLCAGNVARALDNLRLQTEHRRSLDELQSISDIGRAMVASFNLERILEMIAHTALRFIPQATRAVVHLPDEARECLVPRAQAGAPSDPATLVIPWGRGIAGRAAAERRAINIADTLTSPDFLPGTTAILSLAVVPLLVGQAVFGTISISSAIRGAFGERDMRVLASLGSQAAVAIENARLYGEARKADEVAALYELSQALNRSLNLQETITTILGSARSLTFAVAAEVRLVSTGDQELEAVVALGDRPLSSPGDRYRMSVLYPGFVLERRQPLLIEDTMLFELNDEFCRHEPPTWLRSYLGVPLIASQRVVGILSLGGERRGAFTSEDLRLLEIVAGQAATSLSNARLYEEATKRLQEAQALAKVGRKVAASLEQGPLLHAVVATAAETLPLARHSFIYLLGEDSAPRLASVAPEPEGEEPGLDNGIWQWCADGCLLTSEPVEVADTLRQGFPSNSPAVAHSVIAVPMIAAGKAVGVLGADSTLPNAFNSSDVQLLQAFADQAATAIENARLFADLNRAYRDLAQSTETLSALFNGITDGMYIVDSDDRLAMINTPEAAFLGAPADALVGIVYSAMYHVSEGRCEHCLVQQALARGEHQSAIVSYSSAQGAQVQREVDAYPISDREGLTDRVVVFTRDVTARRRMEASLFESSRLASIGQLATSIAHEVNNPLTVIIGNAEVMLLDQPDDGAERETIEMILRAARRAAHIVQNVLELSSQRDYEFAEVDIEVNCQQAIELVAYPLRKAGIVPRLSVAADLPLIMGSANHLKVVWMNLLLNARDAIVRAHRQEGRVEVVASLSDAGTVCVAVRDNGDGIEEDERERLFQPFYTTKSPDQGLGLGLYNVYSIVTQHHGRVEVASRPGEETTFSVHLPLDPESDSEVDAV